MKIAISGKGGVGKTTLAAALARVYAGRGARVLAVDADPATSLAQALGVPAELAATIRPITEMKELIEERTGTRPGTYGGIFSMNPDVDDIPDRFALELGGVRLLVTGGLKDAAAGCYCPENELLKVLLLHIFTERDEVVILDMEAGIEHLTRGTTAAVDAMIIVVEPGQRSVRVALTIERLAGQLGIKRVYFVANKVADDAQLPILRALLGGRRLIGVVRSSRAIAEADLLGQAVDQASPELMARVERIVAAIESPVA